MFTYLISGPIKSRAVDENWCAVIKSIAEELKNRCPSNQLLVSTYPNEIDEIADIKIIINEDPGHDQNFYHTNGKIQLPRNTLRMLNSTFNGIKLVDTDWCIRSRVELLPNIKHIEKHISKIEELIQDLGKIKKGGAVFLASNFHSSIISRKGSILSFSDIFSIMKTQDIRAVWETAQKIYLEILNSGIQPKHPLMNEQIIGQAYMNVFYNLRYKEFNSRYFFKKDLFMKELEIIVKKLIIIESDSLYIMKSRVSSMPPGRQVLPKNLEHKNFLLIKFKFWRFIALYVRHNKFLSKLLVFLVRFRKSFLL